MSSNPSSTRVSFETWARRILGALGAAGVSDSRWTFQVSGPGVGSPALATIWCPIPETNDTHGVVDFREVPGGVDLWAADVKLHLAGDADLEAALPKIVAAVRDWCGRLTIQKVVPGRRYRVLKAFLGVPAGATLTFIERSSNPHGSETLWRFGREGAKELWMYDVDEGDMAVMRELHRYLEAS